HLHPAAPAETDGPQLAVRQLMRLQEPRAVDHVLPQLALIECCLHRASIVVVTGIASDRCQTVGRKRKEPGDRGAPRDVFDVRIEPAVFVNDEHRGKWPGGALYR